MKAKKKGDKTFDMFAQHVAARLNFWSYNPHDCILDQWKKAGYWLIDHPVGSNVRAKSDDWQEPFDVAHWPDAPPETASELHSILDAYNNGELCGATHRDDL